MPTLLLLLAVLSYLRAPVLIVHSEEDRLIPVAHSRRLHAAAVEPKALVTARTGGTAGCCTGRRGSTCGRCGC